MLPSKVTGYQVTPAPVTAGPAMGSTVPAVFTWPYTPAEVLAFLRTYTLSVVVIR